MPKHPWTPRALLFYNSSCLSDRAGRRVEESCRGFFVSNWLCSKPGRSLCERIKLTFATAPGCLHSLSLGRHDCFCRLCNQFLPKTLHFSLQRHKSCKKCSFLRLFAGFFMEESCFGFLIAGGLCSKLGRSLCERIKLTFATAQGCLHSLSLGRHDRFGRLCNLGLSKKQRFSLQRHKTREFG